MERTSGVVKDLESFEGAYYEAMPDVVRDAIMLRDEGWRIFQNEGISQIVRDYLYKSIESQATESEQQTSLVPTFPNYGRELYASLARFAQVEFATGRGGGASARFFVCRAAELVPARVEVSDCFGNVDGRPDQYEIIFGSKLALAMSTMPGMYRRAWRMAAMGRQIADLSQNRESVLFADTEMSNHKRAVTAIKDSAFAWAVSGSLLIPSLSARAKLAEKVLAK